MDGAKAFALQRLVDDGFLTLARHQPAATVRLASLAEPKRRAVWNWLRREQPELAAWLSGPEFQALRQAFGASPVLPAETVRRALKEEAAHV